MTNLYMRHFHLRCVISGLGSCLSHKISLQEPSSPIHIYKAHPENGICASFSFALGGGCSTEENKILPAKENFLMGIEAICLLKGIMYIQRKHRYCLFQ